MSPTPFLLRPIDWVSFGPPRSQQAGEVHHRGTQFPPSPTTFQGLVRSHLLRAARPPLDLEDRRPAAVKERAELIGNSDSLPRGWQLTGPFPACTDEEDRVLSPWVPAPRFLLGNGKVPLHLRRMPDGHGGRNDLHPAGEPPLLGRPEEGDLEALGGWIGPTNLLFALSGERSSAPAWDTRQHHPRRPSFVQLERRPGIRINDETGTAEDAMLYVMDVLRFGDGHPDRPAGLLGWLDAELPARISAGALHEGTSGAGKGGHLMEFLRPAALHPDWRAMEAGVHLPPAIEEGECFYLVALTPAALSAEELHRPLPAEHLPGVTLAFHATLAGHRETLGGFDMAKGGYRPNRSYVPAGSCWLFSLKGGSAAERRKALDRLHNRHVLGPPGDRSFGYGHTLVARGPLPARS